MDPRFAFARRDGGDEARTPLAPFNRLCDEARDWEAGSGHLQDVLDALGETDRALGQMLGFFQFELQFQEDSDALAEQVERVYAAFAVLRDGLGGLRESLEREDPERARMLLDRCRGALDRLFDAFSRLREDETPGRLGIPWADEVLRCAEMVLEERLSAHALATRLDGAVAVQAEWQMRLMAFAPSSGTAEVAVRLHDALERQGDALAFARSALEAGDAGAVQDGVDAFEVATRDALDAQAVLESAGQGAQKPCIRCGAANPRSGRFCVKCNAALPFVAGSVDEDTPHFDIRHDGLQTAGHAEQPENLRRLSDALDAARGGDAEPLREVVGMMESRTKKARQKMSALTPPPEEAGEDAIQAYQAARAYLESAVARYESGLARLRAWLDERVSAHLEEGFAEVIAGTDDLHRMDEEWKRLLAARGIQG
ncbi:MAG: zinc ribbon domain-containing protein [Armatimonadetes bacterium]|nr:zinc ribbon domain-containing protein [Armatimonadota bacterium]